MGKTKTKSAAETPEDMRAMAEAAAKAKATAAPKKKPKAAPKKTGAAEKAGSHIPEQARAAMEAAKKRAEAGKDTYVVVAGDSLSKIALNLLGDASRWPEIYELNKDQIENPDLIHIGQKFRIPKK